MDQQQPEDAGHLGGEVDDVLAQLERGGASDVLPGGLLLRPRHRAEQADVGGARLPRQAGQWNRDEDWLKIKVFPFHIFLTKTIDSPHGTSSSLVQRQPSCSPCNKKQIKTKGIIEDHSNLD